MKSLIITLTCCSLLVLVHFAGSHVLRETGCPPAEDIYPCLCYNSPYTVLNCSNILNGDDLRAVFQNSERYTYREVHVEYSSLQYLPHDMFEHTPVKSLYLKNVTLAALFDSPPESLYMLDTLYIENTRIMSSMSWSLMEPMTQLRLLTIYYNSVRTLDYKFAEFVTKNLKQITFYATDTKTIKPGTFTEFTDLDKIAIDACKLSQLSRDMFPSPFNVRVLYFNDNKITSIPQDMFIDMPNLQTLGLRNNLISTIPEAAFKGNIGRITYVRFDGNPLKCDCLLEWIVRDKPADLGGRCEAPKSLYGRNLMELTPGDFNC